MILVQKIQRRNEEGGSEPAVSCEHVVSRRRNPVRGQGAAKGKSTVVVHVLDDVDDDLFDDDVEPNQIGDEPKANEGPEDEIITPGARGERREKASQSKGKADPNVTVVVNALSTPGAGTSSSAQTSFTLSGAFCESLGAMTSSRLRSMTDEQIVAAVPQYGQINQAFQEVVSISFLPRPYCSYAWFLCACLIRT